MAGGVNALYSQSFTSTDTISVTHNLDRVVYAVRVIIGNVVRNDLVQTTTPSVSDPRNIAEVVLTSSQSGTIQILDSDYIWGTLSSPEGAAALQNNISGSTFSGSFSGSFFGDGSNLTGVTADWDGTHVGDAQITGTLYVTEAVEATSFTGSFLGDLVGTASFASEVGRVENALVDGTGITTLFFDGSTPGTNVSIDQSIVVTLTGSQTLSNKVVSGSFSGSFVGDGSGLTGVGGGGTPGGSNTQIQYNNAGAFGGSADFTFDSSATALALTGTFNGRRYYPNSATDPTSPTPADSDIYYNTVLDMQMIYDATRSKWLSVESSIMDFGRSGNTGGGAYYRGPGEKAYSTDRGRTAEYNGTVVSITYTRNDLDAATFEVTADGTGIATLASSALTGKDITLNGDFSADEILGVKNQTGSNTTRGVTGWVRLRWRA